jgi:hypothetical protein
VETNKTSHAVDLDKKKNAFAAVSFVVLENIIFLVCCNGTGSCTAQPPFLSGGKPVRMRHMKEKFTKSTSSLDGVQISKVGICTVMIHGSMSNGSISGMHTIALIIFAS